MFCLPNESEHQFNNGFVLISLGVISFTAVAKNAVEYGSFLNRVKFKTVSTFF